MIKQDMHAMFFFLWVSRLFLVKNISCGKQKQRNEKPPGNSMHMFQNGNLNNVYNF